MMDAVSTIKLLTDLRKRFPYLELDVTESNGKFYPYMNCGEAPYRSSVTFSFDRQDLYQALEAANFIQSIVASLKKSYSSLYFIPGSHNGYFQSLVPGNNHQWIVFLQGVIAKHCLAYPFHFSDYMYLQYLQNSADDKHLFYCSKCDTFKPHTEYAGYYFSQQRCKSCADKNFLQQARSETYG